MSSVLSRTKHSAASSIALAVPAGALASLAQLPLPWMIGPLLLIAALRMRGLRLEALPGGRQAGQWAIGTALGLYFTPAVVSELGTRAGLVLVIASCALLLGLCCAGLTRRLSGCDRATAFFAALPGGASEMAVLAERYGGAVDLIAAAHALRVLIVVIAVPMVLSLAGAHGSDAYQPTAQHVVWALLPVLIAVSLLGVGLCAALGIANAWVLGPLFAVGLFTATGHKLSALPVAVVDGGQLLIGCALGCRFGPDFLGKAPRFLAAALLSALLALALGALLALSLGWLTPIPMASLALAAAPGGLAEMSITAQVLQLGVPLVTACHVLRVVILTLGAPPLYRLVAGAQRYRSA